MKKKKKNTSVDGLNSGMEGKNKRIGRMVEITQCEQQRENRPERKAQQSLRGLWDETSNIHVI